MKLTFRWYGQQDRIKLEEIRQIPGVTGIVSAIYDVPVGEVWPVNKIIKLKEEVEAHGLNLEVIESVPVHEDIKLGLPTRNKFIENYCQTLRNLARLGVNVVCYNFMPVFDWTRTQLNHKLDDGSNTLIYQHKIIKQMDPLKDKFKLPGWDTSYDESELSRLLKMYKEISEEDLWENLVYFIKPVIEVAEEVGIKMAIHPDDPPWSIFGLPRIITNKETLDRFINLVNSPSNGITMCSGSLGANPENDIPDLIRYFGKQGKIHFAHVRNIRITGEKSFEETSHWSKDGSLDMYEIMKAYADIGFDGPLRPDHGRMIWGEKGRPGYGLYDRALGATYLNGIWEALNK